MPTSPYFNQYTHPGQQSLLESLIIQSIKIYGFNMYYLRRTNASFDEIFRESDVNIFESAVIIETYLKSTEGFEGDGQFMSIQLGFEIRDQMTFTIAKKVFETLIDANGRPREGDLIYLPLDKKCYEIKFVNHQAVFYQLGKLNTYDLTCELIEFNGQIFRTGVPEIDSINTLFELDGTEDDVVEDWIDQSSEMQVDTPDLIDFSEKDPFSRGGTL